MGTAVLSPQHCLPFHDHHRHDSPLLETISDRKMKSTFPRPSPSLNGILLAPDSLPSSHSAVQLCSRNNGVDVHSSSSSSSFLSRASSSCSRASPLSVHSSISRNSVERIHSSAGKHPFCLVQGSATQSSDADFSACLQANSKKFSQGLTRDSRLSSKCSGLRSYHRTDVEGDIGKRAQADFLLRKEIQNARNAGNGILVDNVDVNYHVDGANPRSKEVSTQTPVKILQRSKTDDTCLPELDLKAEGRHGSGRRQTAKEEVALDFRKSHPLARSCSDAFAWKYSSTSSSPPTVKESVRSNGAIDCGGWQAPRKSSQFGRMNQNAIRHENDLADNRSNPLFIQAKKDERWAGPAFSNSPPPNSLPLPKFSLKQQRSYSLRLLTPDGSGIDNTVVQEEHRTASAPSSPPGQSGVCWHNFSTGNARVDVACATKDLRRILHLDY